MRRFSSIIIFFILTGACAAAVLSVPRVGAWNVAIHASPQEPTSAPSTLSCDVATDSDVQCEDFEGSSLCFAAYTSNCRSTFDGLVVSTGEIVDFDAAIGGTYPCTDGDTYAMTISSDGGASQDAYVYIDTASAIGAMYSTTMFRVVSEGLADGESMPIMSFFTTSFAFAGQVLLYQNSGALYLAAFGTTGAIGTTAITVGTWYEVSLTLAASTVRAYLNGVEEASDTAAAATSRYLEIGKDTGVGADKAFNFQYKNVKIDDDTRPDSCAGD